MPLLALFLENDDEQRLNVELSHHADSHCQKPQVYGTSFELLNSATHSIRGAANATNNNNNHRIHWRSSSPAWKEFEEFVEAVHASRVSESFYRHFDADSTSLEASNNATASIQGTAQQHDLSMTSNTTFEEDIDHFHGLPDAAAIILEIIKEVKNGR
jgi:hypothetical protein